MSFARCCFLATLLFAFALFSVACDSATPEVEPDSGIMMMEEMDAGPPPAPYTCESSMSVEGSLTAPVSVTIDTSMLETQPRDLGYSCGNTSGELRWPRQGVVALTVPGTDPVTVRFTTATGDTMGSFRTVVQVRESCDTVPAGGNSAGGLTSVPPTCFYVSPNAMSVPVRAEGAIAAMGGDTLYFIVTGYGLPSTEEGRTEGPISIEFTVAQTSAPVLSEEGTAISLILEDTVLTAAGTDADGDAPIAYVMQFLRGGSLADINGDGVADDNDTLWYTLQRSSSGNDFNESLTIAGNRIPLANFLSSNNLTQARVRVMDADYNVSNTVEVPVSMATLVGLGETCDGAARVCSPPLLCNDMGVCEPTAEARAVCETADMEMTAQVFFDAPGSADVSGTLMAAMGHHETSDAMCVMAGATSGDEDVYRVEIDAGDGPFTLTASTASDTGGTDTVIYMRRTCLDPSTELGCNDDIARGNTKSTLEATGLSSGFYYIFVESYGGRGGAYSMNVTVSE